MSRRDLPLICGAFAAAIACLVLAGWAFDVQLLKSVGQKYVAMKPNTAVGLGFLAAVLVARRFERNAAAIVLSIVPFAIAIITLLEYATGWNAGIDELLFPDPDAIGGHWLPGRLAPITAICFILLVLALGALRRPGEWRAKSSQGFTLVALVLSAQALTGYAVGITYQFGSAFYTQIAVHTAVALTLLCIGSLALRADEGVMAVFLAKTEGGTVARRLIVAAMVVPPLLTWVQMRGERAGLYDADFGVLLRVVGNVLFIALVVWRTASTLHVTDLGRLKTRAELERLNAELEERVAARTAELEAANRELQTFSYSVSHDLRAPLRAIDGFSQALEEDAAKVLDAESLAHLQRIRSNTRRMGELIEGLLDLSRLGQQALVPARVDLSTMAREIFAELEKVSPRPGSWKVEDGLVAQADPRLVRAVLDNLIRNAWKFSAKVDSPRVEVGRAADGAFFVRDNGAGFDMKYVDKLFGVFQRLHREADFPGTGVGLATVQRIVLRHRGRVWAESEVGQGATFFFTLPGELR